MAKKRSDGRYAKQVVLGYRNGKPVRKTIYGKTLKGKRQIFLRIF